MSDQEKLYRCMGGKHCNHIPGSCTATNTAYQGRISPAFASHPVSSSPVVDHETANVSVKLRGAVEVWRDAYIEADRQATRAALVAEIVAWLRDNSTPHNDIDEWADEIEAKWGKKKGPTVRPTHPGEILREDVLPAWGRSKAEVAHLLGISRQTLYDILGERQPISPVMALRIGKLCGNGAAFWLKMQAAYDLAVEGAKMEAEIARIPTLEMA